MSPTTGSGDAADAISAEESPLIRSDRNDSRNADVNGSTITHPGVVNGSLEPLPPTADGALVAAAAADPSAAAATAAAAATTTKGRLSPWLGSLAAFLSQARDILQFAGPALGIWLSHPLMSLIDTAVVGQGSATELAVASAPSAARTRKVGWKQSCPRHVLPAAPCRCNARCTVGSGGPTGKLGGGQGAACTGVGGDDQHAVEQPWQGSAAGASVGWLLHQPTGRR